MISRILYLDFILSDSVSPVFVCYELSEEARTIKVFGVEVSTSIISILEFESRSRFQRTSEPRRLSDVRASYTRFLSSQLVIVVLQGN